MTSSVEPIGDLPPALRSMWRLCLLGYRQEPRLMVAAFVLSQRLALPDALLALWLMLLGNGVLEHRPGLVTGAAVGLGVSAAATWFLRTVSTRVQRRFRDRVTIALESHVARLQASIATVAHHERPEYLDRPGHAPRSGLRARSHVHVGVRDVWLDPAPGRDGHVAGVHSSGARAAGALRRYPPC
jgi:ATP-binding cassette subfamily B protein